MRIGIVGAGLTGLTAGYRLSKAGHKVTIFEKEDYLGGLASGFKEKNWHWSLERFFHHFFASDQAAKNLIKELDLSKRLFYTRLKTSIFENGKICQFDSPLSVLKFPHLSLLEKLRTGLVTLYLRSINNWQKLEKTTAENWLPRFYGKKPYQLLWQPLLESKFGQYTPKISMAWFWARIKKRSSKLGYLEGGFQVLIDKLTEKIKENGGEILLNSEINDLDYLNKFNKVVVTIPTPEFLKMKPLLADYKNKLKKFHFVGALNLILVLKEKFLTDGTYWLNINEKEYPFVAVVEHTNFVAPKYYNDDHILYVGGYYSKNHRYFKMSKEEIFKIFKPYLKKINPKLYAMRYTLYTNPYAQPVIPTNYSKIMPSMKTPIKNLYLANQSLIYPWDRGVNYAIKLGEGVTKLI